MSLNQTRAQDLTEQHEVDVLIAASPANTGYFADYDREGDPLFKQSMIEPEDYSNPLPSFAPSPNGSGARQWQG